MPVPVIVDIGSETPSSDYVSVADFDPVGDDKSAKKCYKQNLMDCWSVPMKSIPIVDSYRSS